MLQCVAVCCSVLLCVAVCCSVPQCVACVAVSHLIEATNLGHPISELLLCECVDVCLCASCMHARLRVYAHVRVCERESERDTTCP